MALANLAELRTFALGPRTDLVGLFGNFLALAEQRIYYGGDGVAPLRVLPMEKTVSLSFVDGSVSLPADFLDKRALYWVGTPTYSLSYEPPAIFYAAVSSSNVADAYTIEGEVIKIRPELTGSARMLYYGRAASLTMDPDTNVILAKWPGVYLFACQVEMYRYLRDDAELAKAARMFMDAVSAANSQALHARTYGSPLRKRRIGFEGAVTPVSGDGGSIGGWGATDW